MVVSLIKKFRYLSSCETLNHNNLIRIIYVVSQIIQSLPIASFQSRISTVEKESYIYAVAQIIVCCSISHFIISLLIIQDIQRRYIYIYIP